MRRRRPGRQRGTAGEREGGEGSDPLRLVLALGGRASLGAYVAGAVAELLDALERDPGADVRVHVIAGSSAGALTAALAARALTVNPGVVPWMRKLWVEALDADLLLEPGRAQTGALFDGAVIEELGRALIAADPAADDRRAPAAGDPLRLGFTLSDLSGVPLRPPARFLDAPERTARLPAHAGAAEFELRTDTRPDAPVWEAIRRAATASAAFPFVFPPHSIERPDSPGVEPRPDDGPARRRWYADGGLLGDGPLALARHLVGRSPDHGSARWLYIAVDPDLQDVVDFPPGAPDSPGRLAVALSRALLGGSAARDRARAEETSARAELFEALVRRLPDLADRLWHPDAFEVGHALGGLAEQVAEARSVAAGDAGGDVALDTLDRGLARIEADPRFAAVLGRVGTRAGRTRLAKLIYVLEAVADLENERVLPLQVVAPRPDEPLAGGFLGGLGGFLGAAWRAHDFEAGRRDAARLLTRHLSDRVRYEGDPAEMRPPSAPPASYEGAPPEVRARVDRFVEGEVDRLLAGVDPGFVGRLFGFAWKPALRRWASRRVRAALDRADG